MKQALYKQNEIENNTVLRYFRLPPNLAHRKLTDLANHRPSFMPYKAVGVALDFFERGSEMASGSRRTRERLFTRDEALQQIFADESGSEGMSSGEESGLDRQLYDLALLRKNSKELRCLGEPRKVRVTT